MRHASQLSGRYGFTLTELMISTTIMTVLVAMGIGAYTSTLQQAREGTYHNRIIDESRTAEQRIMQYIQRGKALGVDEDRLTILMPDDALAEIRLVDADDDPDTVEDNEIRYDPNVDAPGGEVVVCDHVAALPGEDMFQILPTTPRTALISFHVGELAAGREHLLPGAGYQGVEIRVAATPRNLGTVYYQ